MKKAMKDQAIELVKKIIPYVYCYAGSGFMTDWYDHQVALMNAKNVCRAIGVPLMPEVEKLTVNDVFIEEELQN